MPEGDAVWRTATRLHAALAGERLTRTDFRWPSLATVDLSGAVTTAVVPRGKHLLHRLDSGVTICSHLRMDGRWRVRPTAQVSHQALRDPWLRVLITTESISALGLRLGRVGVVRTDEEHRIVGHLGPDPLGEDWDPDRAVANLLAAGPAPIAAALLDQRTLAGLGTMWVAETLAHEQIAPLAPIDTLDRADLGRIARRASALLSAARDSRHGQRREGLLAYGRVGRPCPRCGRLVRTAEVGAATTRRRVAYCPGCQAAG